MKFFSPPLPAYGWATLVLQCPSSPLAQRGYVLESLVLPNTRAKSSPPSDSSRLPSPPWLSHLPLSFVSPGLWVFSFSLLLFIHWSVLRTFSFFQSCLSLCSGSVDSLALRYQDMPIKVVAPWKIGQTRAHGQIASCPLHTSSGWGKRVFLLLITHSSFRNLMKNYLVLSSHVVRRQMGRWKRRPTKQPYRTGLHFLSIIHGVRITLLITKVSTLHRFFFFFLTSQATDQKKQTSPGSLSRDLQYQQRTLPSISSVH